MRLAFAQRNGIIKGSLNENTDILAYDQKENVTRRIVIALIILMGLCSVGFAQPVAGD